MKIEKWQCRGCRAVLTRDQCTTRRGQLECGSCLQNQQTAGLLVPYGLPDEPAPLFLWEVYDGEMWWAVHPGPLDPLLDWLEEQTQWRLDRDFAQVRKMRDSERLIVLDESGKQVEKTVAEWLAIYSEMKLLEND